MFGHKELSMFGQKELSMFGQKELSMLGQKELSMFGQKELSMLFRRNYLCLFRRNNLCLSTATAAPCCLAAEGSIYIPAPCSIAAEGSIYIPARLQQCQRSSAVFLLPCLLCPPKTETLSSFEVQTATNNPFGLKCFHPLRCKQQQTTQGGVPGSLVQPPPSQSCSAVPSTHELHS